MRMSERNPVVLGAITAAVVAVATTLALALEAGFLRGGYELVVELDDVAGLREGEPVRLAGLPAGSISELRIGEGHMEAVVRIEGHELPADSRAKVTMRTALGQRMLELEPGTSWDQLLGEGERIPAERTTVPDGMPDLADETEELLDELDTEALDLVVAGATETLEGQRDPVGELARAGTELTDVIVGREAELRSLLDDLDRLATAVADRDDELLAAVDGLGVALDGLADRRERIGALARNTEEAVGTTARLVDDETEAIDAILTELRAATDALDDHALDVAETFAYAGDALVGFAEVGYHGDQPQHYGDMFTSGAGVLGLDLWAGCGGVIDQALDTAIGPDPRTCAEQANQTPTRSPSPEERQPLDALGRRSLRGPQP